MYNVIAFTAEQEKEAEKMADRIEIDLGDYNPELGYSYGEIAGMSRSQHRSQGMGAREQKGSMKNYLVTIAGDKATKDPFDDIDTTWSRIAGGATVQPTIEQALSSFVPAHPEALLKDLTTARAAIAPLQIPWTAYKLKELDETIAQCAALWLDASSDQFAVTPAAASRSAITALIRNPAHVTLLGVGAHRHRRQRRARPRLRRAGRQSTESIYDSGPHPRVRAVFAALLAGAAARRMAVHGSRSAA